MTDHNPYDFLSGDEAPSSNGKTPSTADLTAHAPNDTIARADSVAALAAREAHDAETNSAHANGTNGKADYESVYDAIDTASPDYEASLENVPELAPLADGGDVPPPSDSERAILQPQEPIDPNAPNDVEQDIWSHLGELRSRLLKSIFAVLITTCITWNFTDQIQDFLLQPAINVLTKHGIKGGISITDPMQAFTTYFQLSLVAGLIIAAPIVLWQAWRFIEPALTGTEKRFSRLLLPFSIILFFMGCALGYFTSPLFFAFFLSFAPKEATVLWTYTSVVILLGKMLLVFGVCFQVPVVTIFLNKTGIVSRNWLIEYWRHAVIAIFIVVAVITPTWDPFTLMICAVPPCLLYGISIWLVKWL
jgi:sec-independent protein translocase protein TatC